VLAALRRDPPTELAGRRVERVTDHRASRPPDPIADVVVLELGSGSWMAVRPSGTEPKLKVYAEVVEPVGGADAASARARAGLVVERLQAALGASLGFPDRGTAPS
jgi:phosphomannomutase